MGILDLANYVQQQGALGKEAGQKSRLAKLYSQALAAPEDQRDSYLPQMAAESPDAANAASGQFSTMRKQAYDDLGREAGMFVALAQSGDAATAQAAYTRLAQKAQAAGHPVPPTYDPKMLPMIEKLASTTGGDDLKSLRIGANGNYWAIRGGQFVDTGVKADPKMQLRDQPGIAPGLVNLRDGSVTPLGANPQQQPQSFAPPPQVTDGIDMTMNPGANVPPQDEVAMLAAAQNPGTQYVPQPNGGAAPMAPYGDIAAARPAIAPAEQQRLQLAQEANQRAAEASRRADEAARLAQRGNAPAGYRFKPDGSLEPIPGAPASPQQLAQQAKQEKAVAAKADTLDTMDQSISAIDDVLRSPGFKMLGTYTGDVAGMLPHTDTANAQAALDVVKNQVLLNTISKLKALSATGASGFGSLSNQEGEILKNSMASLTNAQSNPAIRASLLRIQAALKRSRQRVAGQEVSFPETQQGQQQPQAGHVDDLLSKYGVK